MRSVIRINKPNQPEFLIWFILLFPFTFALLIEVLGLPSSVKYICDICWIFLFVLLLIQKKPASLEKKIFRGVILCFFLFTLIVYVFKYQSAAYYLWGVRNNFRFYVAFLAFITFLQRSHIKKALSLFDKLFWVNAAVCLFQFFFSGIKQDNLGGMFGTESGCSAYTNIFLMMISAKSIIFYLNHKEDLWQCISKCGMCLVIAALGELKFFMLEFALILAICVLITDFSWRKLLLIIGGFIGIIASIRLLVHIFPFFAETFTLEAMFDLATSESGYTSSGDLNRLNAIPIISESFLPSTVDKLTGMGLGNCDTSAYSFLNTPFYQQYSWLHYSWLSTAFMFIENGFIGLAFLFAFFIIVFFMGKQEKGCSLEDKMYCQLSRVFAICCIICAVYNSSLRMESGYMAYFMLSFPFIIKKTVVKPGRVRIKL